MAESGMSSAMPETDIKALKETLQSQQLLLQKLYIELDEEREASATAANEALSMILRLQGEKAAVQMEANQYKRLAEEKMSHAENSLWVFEDLIYQKEMEIASHEFQVQAYRCKLLSMGCTDLGTYESRFPENLFLQRTDSSKVEMGDNSNVRRLKSLPPIQLKEYFQKKSPLERERSVIPMSVVKQNTDGEVNVQNLDLEKKSGNSPGGSFDSYWEQIRKLDERVKDISGGKVSGRDNSANLKEEYSPSSLLPQVSIDIYHDPKRGEIFTNFEKVKPYENTPEREVIVNSSCSSSVQDIYEVPKSTENRKAYEHQRKEQSKLVLESENRLGKPDMGSEDSSGMHIKDAADKIKKMLLFSNHDCKLSKARDGLNVDCNAALVQPTIDVVESQAKFQQLYQRIEQLEGNRNYIRQEISEVGEEEVKLLKEIQEQLNVIQTELKSWRTKKSPPQDEQSLDSLAEV
uniref:GTD-binding domain-containing protein n=1 Tax=Fagus sylvatica TaxID=28930 RepID=A0A2N9FFQ7_FAGSY